MDAYGIGGVFFGWGVAVAVFSVFAAPVLQNRFGAVRVLTGTLVLLMLDLVGLGLAAGHSVPAVVVLVVISGALLGVNNTIYTELAMGVSDSPRPVASAGYNFVRWMGGALAPFAAAQLGEHFGPQVPFFAGALAMVVAIAVVFGGRRYLAAPRAARGLASRRLRPWRNPWRHSFADPFGTNRVSACSRDMPLVSGTLNMTKKNDAAANSAYMAYVRGSEAAAMTGKLRVMAKLAIHCAAAARPRAPGADPGGEDFAQQHPHQRAPGGAETDDEDVGGDQGRGAPGAGQRDGVAGAGGRTESQGHGAQREGHADGACEQDGSAADPVHEGDGHERHQDVGDGGGHGDRERILFLEAHGLPQGGGVVEDHVDADELLQHGEDDADPDHRLQAKGVAAQGALLAGELVLLDGLLDLAQVTLGVRRPGQSTRRP